MHTDISARDSRETVQSDSPRNSQTKSDIQKKEREKEKERKNDIYI